MVRYGIGDGMVLWIPYSLLSLTDCLLYCLPAARTKPHNTDITVDYGLLKFTYRMA